MTVEQAADFFDSLELRPQEAAIADKLLAAHLLEQLSPKDQAIVRMKHFEDLTCAEIGFKIGMNENAVRLRVFRAIKKLQHLFGVTGEGQS